jgi:nitronate monooxygenase
MAGELAGAGTNGGFQLNLWMPDPPPKRDPRLVRVRRFLGKWGPEVPAEAGDVYPPGGAHEYQAQVYV